MTEWGVVTVIIALGGFVLAIVAPVIKLNTTITRLTTIVDRLQKSQDDASIKNTESHRRLWEHNATQDKQLTDHERRITAVEHIGGRHEDG